jgi:hypothetical protein
MGFRELGNKVSEKVVARILYRKRKKYPRRDGRGKGLNEMAEWQSRCPQAGIGTPIAKRVA